MDSHWKIEDRPVITQIKALLPATLEPMIIRVWYFFRPMLRFIFSGRNRYCPVCKSWSRFFFAHGPATRKRKNVVCPICLSHDRHRLAWIFLNSSTDLNDGSPKKLLHLAPETEFERKFRRISGVQYFSADLASPHAMEKMDITNIHWPEASFDIIYCSHVLEHVPEDRRAMSEMLRVLRSGGWALIQVPTSKKGTIEDPSVTDPAERERLFGQSDHVRLYGLDIKDRLAAAGFDPEVIFAHQVVEPQDCERMCIHANQPLFYCKKPAA